MRPRDITIVSTLGVLLLAEGRFFPRWELKQHAGRLTKLASLSVESAEQAGSFAEFDPEFGRFLEGVRRCVPAGEAVAVSLPTSTPRYFVAAQYALAPRSVFDARSPAAARFLAVYRREPPTGARAVWSVPGGSVSLLP